MRSGSSSFSLAKLRSRSWSKVRLRSFCCDGRGPVLSVSGEAKAPSFSVGTARELLLVEMDASLALLGKGPAAAFTTTGVLAGAAAGAAAAAVAVAAAAVVMAAADAVAATSAAALLTSVAVAVPVPVVPAAFAAAAILVLAAVAATTVGDLCLTHFPAPFIVRALSAMLPFGSGCFAETAVTEQISLVSTAPSTVLNSNPWLQFPVLHMSQTFAGVWQREKGCAACWKRAVVLLLPADRLSPPWQGGRGGVSPSASAILTLCCSPYVRGGKRRGWGCERRGVSITRMSKGARAPLCRRVGCELKYNFVEVSRF
jgi:hypothetical protein